MKANNFGTDTTVKYDLVITLEKFYGTANLESYDKFCKTHL